LRSCSQGLGIAVPGSLRRHRPAAPLRTFRLSPVLALTALLLAALSCYRPGRPILRLEDYAVYSAVLSDSLMTQGIRPGAVCYVIREMTVSRPAEMPMTPDHLRRLHEMAATYPGLDEAADAFAFQSRFEARLARGLSLQAPYQLIDSDAADSACASKAGAAAFSARFAQNPPGIFSLSRIGFSRDGQRAYVYIERRQYGSGSGRECFLEKRDHWRVVHWGSSWTT
jgi:hypothetical protein